MSEDLTEIKALRADLTKRLEGKKDESFIGLTVGEFQQISNKKLAMPNETTIYKMVKVVKPLLEKAPAK